MIIKNILITTLICLIVSGLGSAGGIGNNSGYSFDGNGLPEYPNNGTLWASSYASCYTPLAGYAEETEIYNTDGNTVNYYYSGTVSGFIHADTCQIRGRHATSGGGWTTFVGASYTDNLIYTNDTGTYQISTSANKYALADCLNPMGWGCSEPVGDEWGRTYVRVSVSVGSTYKITGNTSCVGSGNVDLYVGESLIEYDYLDVDDCYNFSGLVDGATYKLIFPNSEEHEFTIDGADIIYDYDACIYTVYRFEELCENLIPDSEGFYIEKAGSSVISANDFYAPTGILSVDNSSANNMYLASETFIGTVGWVVDPVVSDTTYTLTNPLIAWGLKVIVVNESDDGLIDGAVVKVDQGCYCTNDLSTRQKTTINGMVEFGDMSLQDASLFVIASGYKIIDENNTGYNVFLSGRTNFSSKTWTVKLAPSWSENVSTFYENNYTTSIHFVDEDGNRTSQIRDTDTEVYLYYENNNSENEAMTLKFQSSSTHTYFSDELSWNIPADSIGHKTIDNAYFTPWDYSYRAVLYNSSIYLWNITIPLTVRNTTKEETIHYQNLTTNLWFTHEADGKIDYREDMQVVSHARSDNTTLMNIDLEVWKDGAMLCYKNLTATDYAGADYPYYYVYEPVFEYVSGSNYTTKMYGFDRTLLEVRYLECINDTTTRKNKLTIGVKDRAGANLDNCYIYLEDWGSLPTGTTYYNSYEGIDNGYYRYKASKSGYSNDGWSDVTMSDGDQIVWYTLTADHTNTSATQQKMTDEDVKGMFFPLMFFLLICIIFGGFKYVSQ